MNTSDPGFNAVDELMVRVDEINGKSPTDLSDSDLAILVAYHRRARAKLAAGDKPPRGARSKAAIALSDLISIAPKTPALPAPTPNVNRSVLRRF